MHKIQLQTLCLVSIKGTHKWVLKVHSKTSCNISGYIKYFRKSSTVLWQYPLKFFSSYPPLVIVFNFPFSFRYIFASFCSRIIWNTAVESLWTDESNDHFRNLNLTPTAREIAKYVWTNPKNEEKPSYRFRLSIFFLLYLREFLQ